MDKKECPKCLTKNAIRLGGTGRTYCEKCDKILTSCEHKLFLDEIRRYLDLHSEGDASLTAMAEAVHRGKHYLAMCNNDARICPMCHAEHGVYANVKLALRIAHSTDAGQDCKAVAQAWLFEHAMSSDAEIGEGC